MKIGEVYNGWKIIKLYTQKNVLMASVVSLDESKTREFRQTNLRTGKVSSPDQIMNYRTYDQSITSHILYKQWNSMKSRARINNRIMYVDWYDYKNFYEYWIKSYKDGLSVSLIDSAGDYIPTNCHLQTKCQISAKNGKIGAVKNKNRKVSREIREKTEATCLKKYGTKSPLQNKEIKDKIETTLMDRYGVKHSSQIPGIQDTLRKNALEKYGVNHHTKTEEYKENAKQRAIYSGLTHMYDGKTSTEKAEELGLSRTGFQQRVRKYGYDIAISMEKSKTAIENVIENVLKKLNISYETGKFIGKYKPDFILPELNIIVECDGLYWHSDAINHNKYYHRDKQEFYKESGYRSLFFREDEIDTKIDIIESMIAHRCKLSRPIYARKCTIEELPHKKVKQFFIDHHLMGNGSGKGVVLKYNGEIVAACQIVQRDYVDISRFCTKLNTHVIGGFSKILSFIDKKYHKDIHTFIDGRYGDGEYLKELGFELKNKDISFKWVKDDKTFHRLKYKGNTGYENRCYKIWDCGQYKYIKKATINVA
jgi:very-short-patch-repair endonuclease